MTPLLPSLSSSVLAPSLVLVLGARQISRRFAAGAWGYILLDECSRTASTLPVLGPRCQAGPVVLDRPRPSSVPDR